MHTNSFTIFILLYYVHYMYMHIPSTNVHIHVLRKNGPSAVAGILRRHLLPLSMSTSCFSKWSAKPGHSSAKRGRTPPAKPAKPFPGPSNFCFPLSPIQMHWELSALRAMMAGMSLSCYRLLLPL